MKIKAYDIKYETDGNKVDLPKELILDIDDPEFDPEMELADEISDRTGWLVHGFEYAILESAEGTVT